MTTLLIISLIVVTILFLSSVFLFFAQEYVKFKKKVLTDVVEENVPNETSLESNLPLNTLQTYASQTVLMYYSKSKELPLKEEVKYKDPFTEFEPTEARYN
jgi:hypothetical protein